MFGEITIPTYYYYNQKKNHGETVNAVGYFEKDSTSPGVKSMVSISNIHFSDKQVIDYLYQISGINLSEKNVINIRHEISATAKEWMESKEPEIKKIDPSAVSGIALSIDEGKARIRSDKKNEETGKYKYEWKNIKLGVCYGFDGKGKKTGRSVYGGEITELLVDFEDGQLRKLRDQSGFLDAKNQIVISDAANGYNNTLNKLAPDAVSILDFTHCKDHLRNIARTLHPDIEPGVISAGASEILNNLVELGKEKGPYKS